MTQVAAPRRFTGNRLSGFCKVLSLWVWLSQLQVWAAPPVLTPTPREVNWVVPKMNVSWPIVSNEVAVVLGKSATDPEKEAARLLTEFVAKRFGQHWPVIREGEERSQHKTLIVLGQRTTCARVDQVCRKTNHELSETNPGFDGYVITPDAEGDRMVVMIGGCNGRGVEYGQDTFAQMLHQSGKSLCWSVGVVRDWPVIPWRGRPQTAVPHYLRPGELDLYVLSRVNFIDLRSGIYAYQPGEKLDRAVISEAIKQAHKRGIMVYGTVNCGVPKAEYPKVMETFREMLELGADGLWLSFDDKGPGEDPVGLAKQVIELGKQHKIGGAMIATTPPKGSYPKITTDFNRKLMAVPGMETAIWFWTAVPSPEAMAEAQAIGLKVKPGWWHNWPRLYTTQGYTGVPPMSLGWSAPDYGLLAGGGDCLDSVMPWGGNGMGQHFVVPICNWWGWNPKGHDWAATRRRIDEIVFGPEQAAKAMKFDDDLQKLFGLFQYSYKISDDVPYCPPRLNKPADKKQAIALAKAMTTTLDQIAAKAPAQTLLSARELKADYLDPMRRELETHRAAAALSFPEDWWPAHQRKVLAAHYAGDTKTVNELSKSARPRAERELAAIQKAMPGFPHLKNYMAWWQQRASLDAKGWGELLAQRRKELAERRDSYSRQIMNDTAMTDSIRNPPLEWGIGRWQVANRLLASVVPAPTEQFWGGWIAGNYKRKDIEAAIFTADRKMPGPPGEYVELPATVPVSGDRKRLGLLLFVSGTNKDLFSNTMVPFRWAGYRYMQVLWEDKVLWETDLGQVSNRGEWFLVKVPPVPEGVKALKLRVRAEDRKLSMNNYTISYFGPIRLLELPAE